MAKPGMLSLPSISGSDEVHERVCSLCSKEDKDVEAVELCMDCEQFLCRSCSMQHGRFKSLQKHKVVQKDQVPNLSLSVLIGSEEAGFECTVCTIYGQYTAARVYCMHCCKYLCSVCENNHNLFGLLRDHKQKAVDQIRKEVNKSQSEDIQYAVTEGKSIRQEKLSCSSCKREIEDPQLMWICVHCGFKNTCQECCGRHQSSNKRHRLIPFKEFKVIYQQYGKSIMSGSEEFTGPVCSKCCEKGLAKYPHMLCTECNIFVCISCKKDHASHRTESEDALEKAIADEIVQMENIEHDCSICLDRNLRSSAAGYCLKCDIFICVGCTLKHAIYFVQESHPIRKLREINLRKEVFFNKTLYSTKIIIDRCDNCSQKGIIRGAAWRCLYCQKSLCMLCSDFHEKSNVGHSLTIAGTKEEKIGKCNSKENQKYLQSPIEKLTDKTKLFSTNGNSMNAGDLFRALTGYLINFALNSSGIYFHRANEIQLVYLVSDTVSTTCQSMLKSAAGKAGIDKDNVSVVSKATSIIKYSEMYSLPQDEIIGQLPDDFWKPGYKFLTAELAYDQAEVSVHERLEDGTCRTIDKRLGEWGFQKCVSECIEVFPLLFGHDVYKDFIEEKPMWLDEITREIASKWFTETQEKSNRTMTLMLPSLLCYLYERKTGKNIGEEIQNLSKLLKVTMVGCQLRFESSVLKTVVENCISGNTSLIKALLSKHRMSGANSIIFFGTLLENNKIKDAMTGNFDGAVIVSKNVANYVKAAIVYDFTKHVENCPFTYGVNFCGRFHDENIDHQLRMSNIDVSKHLFRIYFMKGENVNTGHLRFWRYRSVFPYQGKILMNILQSEKRKPEYADRNEIKELDVITVNLGFDVKYGEVEVRMMFRETGLLVEAFTVQEGTDDKKETLSKVYSKMFR